MLLDILTAVGPALFRGGRATDYVVEILQNGGLGSRHVPSNQVVPHVVAKQGLDLLQTLVRAPALPVVGLVSLGANLLNLGVSTWSAWRLHRVAHTLDDVAAEMPIIQQKLDGVSRLLGASMLHLDNLCRESTLMFGIVLDGQREIGSGIEALRQQLEAGVRSITETVLSVEARSEALDFEQRLKVLLRSHAACVHAMQDSSSPQRGPAAADLRDVIRYANELISWIDARFATAPVGSERRLPLFIARTIALRLEIEARRVLDEAPASRDSELSASRASIRAELHALTDQATLLDLASRRRAIIEQYVYLHRSFSDAATFVEDLSGLVIPVFPRASLTWDDGLDHVRATACPAETAPAPAQLPLRTLAECVSWEHLAKLPRGECPAFIDREELSNALGLHEPGNLPERNLRELLSLAPTSAGTARARLHKELA